MILCDRTLLHRLSQFIQEPDYSLVNPASVDIRVGDTVLVEAGDRQFMTRYLTEDRDQAFVLTPGMFVLVSMMEHLIVPNGYAIEVRLKSSRAREGYEHTLACWFDPGWSGVGTMEIRNCTQFSHLPLYKGLRIAQIVVHKLDGESLHPYQGQYNHANTVQLSYHPNPFP